jgi:aryl-alcohol dehydrogenase-like predicted oxidoreductase
VEYRNLGNSGLQVSVVGLGCNNFGGRIDAEGTATVINKCLDTGITFFDTADIYGGRGKSEEFMGPVLKPHRHNVVIATKSAGAMGEGPYWGGASRRYLMDAVDA